MSRSVPNQDKSAASFCHQVAAWVPDLFCNFNLKNNHKITICLAGTKAREKISIYFETVEFKKFLMCVSLKKKNNQILLNNISCQFPIVCETSQWNSTLLKM
jgi:hypothetical protein